MKKSHLLFLGAIFFIIIIIYSLSAQETSEDYAKAVEYERKEKDSFMKTSEESPFAPDKNSFTGLNYFPPDAQFRISANFYPAENKQLITLPTSDGKEKQYQTYGTAEFHLDGVLCKLTILEILDAGPYRGTLFLAFADETSAKETYGAGRYLDVKKTPGASSILLDFNKAYNPYCAYSDVYSCPFPPRENVLKVKISAGEKTYH